MPTFITGDLIPEERLFEKEELEIEILFGRIKKGDFHSKWDILKKVNEFIAIVEDILRKLEAEKRRNEQIAYNKLQGLYALIGLIKETDFEEIKNALNELKETIEYACKKNDGERRLERRIERGRRIYGFVLKKAKTSVGRDREILAARLDIAKRTPEEIADLKIIENLIDQIKQKGNNEESTKRLQAGILRLIRELKKDFFEIFVVQVDIDLEEVLKLRKMRKLRKLLETLNINDQKRPVYKSGETNKLVEQEIVVIRRLKILESSCMAWARQDRMTEERLEALTKKLEEKTTRIIEMKDRGPVSFRLIVNPYDPDFNSLYDNIYAKVPGWDPEEQFETKRNLQLDMSRKEWFCLVAKVGNKVVGGVYFGYYILHRWKGAIGYSGYEAVRKEDEKKGLGPKLVELSEYYLKRIAYQKGYNLLMIIRFVPGKEYTEDILDYTGLLRYLKKIRSKKLNLSSDIRYVEGHDQYVKLLKEFKKKDDIPIDLWLDFLAKITIDVNRSDPLTDSDFQHIKRSLKSQGVKKIKLEEINV